MYKFCVFAGTTEGRELVEFLAGQEDVSVTACVATDYGEALLPPAENLTVSARRMTARSRRTSPPPVRKPARSISASSGTRRRPPGTRSLSRTSPPP